jgi:hypothetical protein
VLTIRKGCNICILAEEGSVVLLVRTLRTEAGKILTFGLTLLEGHSREVLGDQVSPTKKARGSTDLWLVGSQRARHAGDEAIVGIVTLGTLT